MLQWDRSWNPWESSWSTLNGMIWSMWVFVAALQGSQDECEMWWDDLQDRKGERKHNVFNNISLIFLVARQKNTKKVNKKRITEQKKERWCTKDTTGCHSATQMFVLWWCKRAWILWGAPVIDQRQVWLFLVTACASGTKSGLALSLRRCAAALLCWCKTKFRRIPGASLCRRKKKTKKNPDFSLAKHVPVATQLDSRS